MIVRLRVPKRPLEAELEEEKVPFGGVIRGDEADTSTTRWGRAIRWRLRCQRGRRRQKWGDRCRARQGRGVWYQGRQRRWRRLGQEGKLCRPRRSDRSETGSCITSLTFPLLPALLPHTITHRLLAPASAGMLAGSWKKSTRSGSGHMISIHGTPRRIPKNTPTSQTEGYSCVSFV